MKKDDHIVKDIIRDVTSMDDKEAYQRVIEVLTDPMIDFKAIAINVAKENPQAFLAGLDYSTNIRDNPQFQNRVKDILLDNKIQAIKYVREQTQMGLKEAKDYVESL